MLDCRPPLPLLPSPLTLAPPPPPSPCLPPPPPPQLFALLSALAPLPPPPQYQCGAANVNLRIVKHKQPCTGNGYVRVMQVTKRKWCCHYPRRGCQGRLPIVWTQ